MQIRRISRIRNHKVFRDFTWPASLPFFGRLNLVYGWNGSGKSTLSNLFRSVEERSAIVDGEVTFDIDGTSLRGADLGPTAAVPRVKVFNRAFIDESVFSPGGVRPIFYIGKESKDKQQEVERLNAQLDGAAGLVEASRKASETLRLADREVESYCSAQALKIKETLRSSGSNNPYNNYNKANYRSAADTLVAGGIETAKSLCLSEKEKDEHTTKKNASRKEPITWTPPVVPNLGVARSTIETLLARTVVSAALPALTSDARLERWTKDGLPLHGIPATPEMQTSDTCKFCGKPLSPGRVAELEGHFNEEYERLNRDLEQAKQGIEADISELSTASIPKATEVNEHLRAVYRTNAETLSTEITRTTALGRALCSALEEKLKKPFATVDVVPFLKGLTEPSPQKSAEALVAIATSIETHNRECADFDALVELSRKALAQGAVAESLGDFTAKTTAAAEAKTGESSLNEQIQKIRTRIAELEREIVEHRQAADELNSELVRYLGRDELRFALQGTGYSITRAGLPATHLSEGEKTAIAFLYFLKTLRGNPFDLKNDIVVVDDPVSSLDANSLFCAFGYMKERTKEAGQLFMLTHSFPFFCQIRNWLNWENKRNKNPRPAQFYMLDCAQTPTGRNSQLLPLDKLLEEFDSEYHYLFKKVRDGAALGTGAPLETYYGLPNIARRLLESFLSFRFPNESDLYHRLGRLACDPAVRSRVIRFVHTYSHEGAVGEEHDPTVLAETPGVLKDILEMIEREDGAHFKGMVEAVTAT